MRPHTTTTHTRSHTAVPDAQISCVSAYYFLSTYVSSYAYSLHTCPRTHSLYMCPHTTVRLDVYRVLVLLNLKPRFFLKISFCLCFFLRRWYHDIFFFLAGCCSSCSTCVMCVRTRYGMRMRLYIDR